MYKYSKEDYDRGYAAGERDFRDTVLKQLTKLANEEHVKGNEEGKKLLGLASAKIAHIRGRYV